MRILGLAIAAVMINFSCANHVSSRPPKKGEKVLRMNISREPTTLDPRKVFDPSHQAISSMLFEGLTKLKPDGNVQLAQAESIEISSDRLTYTFQIGDKYWSDGTPVTAQDFESTFLSILDPRFPAPHAHLLYDVKNAQKAKKGDIPLNQVSIHSTDPKTLKIQLERPSPSFLHVLASSSLSPVSHILDQKNASWANKVGSQFLCNGPFMPFLWNHHQELVIHRNPFYRGSCLPKLDSIHLSMIDNETSALHMYASGHIDILGTPFSQIPLPYLKELKNQENLTIQPVAASLFCGFNTKTFPFHNLHLRKAFAYAIQRKEIVQHITQLDEEIGLRPIPNVLLQHRAAPLFQDADQEKARYHFKKALAELHISSRDLESVTLYYWPLEINYRIAQTLQQQWHQELGVKINIEVIDFKSLLTKVSDHSYQLAIFAWSAEYADPLSLLERFRLSSDAKNCSLWESSTFNALLDQSSLEADPDVRLSILEKAEAILVEEMPIAPLFHWNFSLLVQPKVKGFSVDPLGNVHFETITL